MKVFNNTNEYKAIDLKMEFFNLCDFQRAGNGIFLGVTWPPRSKFMGVTFFKSLSFLRSNVPQRPILGVSMIFYIC